MSKYTTEVRYICETYAGLYESVGYDKVDEVIEKSRSKIFDFDYPIFDSAYKGVLEHKILRHYYTREIGLETVGLWKLQLENTMNEIMPYYNQLYKSAQLEFNPLYDVDYTRTGDKKSVLDDDTTYKGNESNTRTDNLKSYDLYSDTPQGALTGVDSEKYLTNARKVTNTGTQKNDGTVSSSTNKDATTLDEYTERVFGKQAGKSYSQLLQEFRDTFLNIDMMIINELRDLFFLLW